MCQILRLDICCDHSEDLMGPITQSIKKGRVHGYKSHLQGVGEVDGTPLLFILNKFSLNIKKYIDFTNNNKIITKSILFRFFLRMF